MRAVVVQHVPFEGPGLIGPALSAVGADVRVVRVYAGEPLPDAEKLDALVVLGGPMGAFDDHAHPHLARERDLIAECVRRGTPVLGVCLGSQLLAAALGAQVWRGPDVESGAGTVTLTPAGSADPVLGPSGPRLPVVHWHHDTFDLPEHGVQLATSERYAQQAFRVGDSYGLQFHVEFDAVALDQAAPHLPPDTTITPDEIHAVAAEGERVLKRWAEHVVTVAGDR
ncbi:type 1 glutamine amidotransferase [Umezawaea endophytica]|uniref:Type 1 glutamine amidotransferase n=1 Tax=Umezawaea endophytica TaxID=1654476 RepID=A0A9X2VPL1_9PSEU|nr:type 1 glutamine amidotransferase [Umezawaea endophytica]MCS7480483.1 type 1 glutamine amidotransferase [Umezawaea endophytica]